MKCVIILLLLIACAKENPITQTPTVSPECKNELPQHPKASGQRSTPYDTLTDTVAGYQTLEYFFYCGDSSNPHVNEYFYFRADTCGAWTLDGVKIGCK